MARSITAGSTVALVALTIARKLAKAFATSGSGPMFFVSLPKPFLSGACALPVSSNTRRISAGVRGRPRIWRAADWIATTAEVTTGEADEVPL